MIASGGIDVVNEGEIVNQYFFVARTFIQINFKNLRWFVKSSNDPQVPETYKEF